MTERATTLPYQAVIFDWDGCVAKSLHTWLGEFKSAFALRGLSPTDADISSRFGHWERIAELGIPEAEVPQFNKAVRAAAELALLQVELYAEARDTLIKLAQERDAKRLGGIALLTGSYEEAIRPPVAYYELTSVFDAIVTRSDNLKDKPDPEGVQTALSRMGFDPETIGSQAVLVGDTDKDIIAAQNAGIDSVWINHELNHIIYGPEQIDYFRSLQPTFEVLGFADLQPLLLGRADTA